MKAEWSPTAAYAAGCVAPLAVRIIRAVFMANRRCPFMRAAPPPVGVAPANAGA